MLGWVIRRTIMTLNKFSTVDLCILRRLMLELSRRLESIALLKLTRAMLHGMCAVIDAELVKREAGDYQVEIEFMIIYPDADREEPDETQPLPAPPDMEHWDLQERSHFNSGSVFADFIDTLDLDEEQ